MNKITFVLPSRNNLDFLKLSYKSIRNLSTKHEILILDDASVDGTKEWIDSLNDEDLIHYHNSGPERIGIVGMFDKGIEMSKTDIIFAFHADMIAGTDLDINILKHLKPGRVVCATRIEPPLHPKGPEKLTENFGIEADQFKEKEFLEYVSETSRKFANKTTEGIFAPWCMYKSDYLAVGGHDELFAPQSKEDSDLFNRFVLNEYEVIQSWDGLVYHFTSRGSRFNKYSGGSAGVDSNEWKHTTTKNAKEFIRKWGHFVQHDAYMKPIIPHKYNIHSIIHDCTYQLLEILEPWLSTVYVNGNSDIVDLYCNAEQQNTKFDLRKKVYKFIPDLFNMDSVDILIEFNAKQFTPQSFNIIQNLSDIITETNELGYFELDCFKITITNLRTYEKELIKSI